MPNDVLIVEDDAIIAIDFEATIMELGIARVRTAAHAADALAIAITHAHTRASAQRMGIDARMAWSRR